MPRLPDRVRRAPGVHPCSPRFAGPLCQPIQARLREDLHRGEGRRLPHITAEKRRDRYPLYDLYGVAGFGPVSAAQILLKGRKAMQLGKVHGLYEGIEGQCPALFLVASDGTIAMTPYGLFDPGKITETLSRLS